MGKNTIATEGKTKKILVLETSKNFCIVRQKNDITAGDGAKKDSFDKKGSYANQTTCNVFELLKKKGIPVSYVKKISDRSFVSILCDMLPYEVVVRGMAYGSYLERYPGVSKLFEFKTPVVEFYLKTTDKKYGDLELPVDDPLIRINQNGYMNLYDPRKPLNSEPSISIISNYPGKDNKQKVFREMAEIALDAFEILRAKWENLELRLVDCKVEFGFDSDGTLLLADVIDNDSWRLLEKGGEHLDKQNYRDGKPLTKVAENYKKVAGLSESLHP